MNIRHILHYSYHEALQALVMGTSAKSLARARERALVKAIASQLQDRLAAEDIRVFSACSRGNAADFASERLLYDIIACRVAFGKTADRHQQPFAYIVAALWQIEIEFSLEWRTAVYALNRLCCGSADNKLLITAQRSSGRDEFMATLAAVAPACSGQVFLALVPHPQDWHDSDATLDIWQLDEGSWRTVL